jgi:hypothetical protein
MQSVLRVNLMYQMGVHRMVVENRDALVERLAGGSTVNIEGYELGGRLFSQVNAFRLKDDLVNFRGSSLLVQINEAASPLSAELEAISGTVELCRATAIEEVPFWRELRVFHQRAPELERVTLDALRDAA